MTGFIEQEALRFEGLDDKDITDLTAILPDLQILNSMIQQQMPRIAKVTPVLTRIADKIIAKQKELK